MQTHRIGREAAVDFSRVWTKNGLAFILPDVALDFATDFANLVLRDFIEMCQKQATEAARARQAQQIVLG